MRIREFEEAVLDIDEVVIRIRAPVLTEVDEYEYQRAASGTTSVNNWLENRIRPCIGEHQVSVVDGNGQTPHGRTMLDTLRSTYER